MSSVGKGRVDLGSPELLERLRQEKPPEHLESKGAQMGWRAAHRKAVRRLERLYGAQR